jgi:hypothetical protein
MLRAAAGVTLDIRPFCQSCMIPGKIDRWQSMHALVSSLIGRCESERSKAKRDVGLPTLIIINAISIFFMTPSPSCVLPETGSWFQGMDESFA